MADALKTVVPWGLHPLPSWIVKEFTNRSNEYGMNPTATAANPYSGPRTAWTRVFSNGKSKIGDAANPKLDGFLMGGVFDFNDSFGFNKDKKAAIGVDANGNYHLVNQELGPAAAQANNDFMVRPPPSVTSMECELFGSQNASFPSLCRKVKVNWSCYSLTQLNYMIPYFLTPRITMLVEWGWNNYNRVSLVDLRDREWIADMFTDPTFTSDYVKESSGNWDAATGFITDFGYSLNVLGGYDCFTTITNTNFLIEGQAIHNQSVVKKVAHLFVPQKTLKEFVQHDLVNIISPAGERALKDLQIDTTNLNHKIFSAGRLGPGGANSDGKKWIRMDLFVDIINAFSSVALVDSNDPTTIATSADHITDERSAVRLNYLTIKDILIAAHPALKSVNPDVLFPNKFAPRFCAKDSQKKSGAASPTSDVTAVSIGGSVYGTLFGTVDSAIKKYKFDTSFDDLHHLINKNGKSFPMFEPYSDPVLGSLPSGYYGQLSDVFISVDMIKALVHENDTILKLLESILQKISSAMCNISQLKLVSSEYGNKYYSINDSSLSYHNTENDAKKLMKITLGDINSAFIRSAGFEVKIAAEMMNQLVAQSANEGAKNPTAPVSTVNNDPKRLNVNRFVGEQKSGNSNGDRLFDYGGLPATTNVGGKSESAKDAVKRRQAATQARVEELVIRDEKNNAENASRMKRTLSDSHPIFYVYVVGDTRYILAEKDSVFMTQLLTGTPDPQASYVNNAIMPGTTFTMEVLGISGITYLSQFTLDHVPDTYNYQNAVWQISDIKHRVENKMWTTSITAQVRPLTILGT